MTREADRPVVSLQHAVKKFGSFTAMSDGCIELYPHRIHALAGENGAGKSTLVKVLAGIHQPNSGEFLVDGQPVRFKTPAESKGAGISVIYQEPTLFPDLTVAENIYVGRQPRGRFGFIDHAAMRRDAQELFDRLEVPIDPSQLADGLSISLDAKVLIMDEPTAALSGHEVDRRCSVARSLRDKGASLMFISHRMEEIFDLCDDVTIMRDGAYVSTRDLKETTKAQLVRDMVGRNVDQLFPKLDAQIGDPVLTVEGLTRYGAFEDVSFEVRSGEILGLAGLVGAGRSEVVRTIMGIDKADGGTVTAFGKPLKLGDTVGAIRAGLAFVPEDRRKQGLVMDLSVARNTALTLRSKLARCGLINSRTERAVAQEWSTNLEVKTASQDTPVSALSGGNQQKVVLAKWLATDPTILIVDEPTRGIDVGTKAEVHRLISTLATRGVAVIMISSELPEILGMADRVLVMCEGRITGEFTREEATADAIMTAATDHEKAAS